MRRKFWIKALAHVCALFVVLATAWVFRTGLVRLVANRVLASDGIVLTRLDKLQLSTSQATTSGLEVQLGDGQRLVLSDVAVGYRMTSLTQAPVVESIAISSAQLLPATGADAEDSADEEGSEPLLLSNVLQLLRELPLTAATIDGLSLPNYDKPLAFSMQHNAGELLVRVDNSDLQFLTSFTQADAAATALLHVTLTRGTETVGNFNVSLQPMQATYALQGEGHLQFADLNTLLGQLQQAPLALPLKSASLDWTLAGSVADDFMGTFNSDAAASFDLGIASGSQFTVVMPESGLSELAMTLKDRATFNFTTGAEARINGALPVKATGSWSNTPFSVDSVLSLSDCNVRNCRAGFTGSANYDTYSMTGNVVIDAMQEADSLTDYHVKTEGLVIAGLPQWAPPFDIDAQLSLAQNRLTFSSPLLLRNAPGNAGISVDGNYDLRTSELAAHLNVAPLEFKEQGGALSNWLSGWPYAFDVLSGTLLAQATVGWKPGVVTDAAEVATDVLTATFEFKANNVGGFYEDIFFRGLTGDLNGTVDTANDFPLDIPDRALALDGIDVGVPIENIKLNFRLDRNARQLVVSSMTGDALGGTVGGNDLRYTFGAERNDLKLEFNGLRIERMMELADYDGVQASGGVSGELPLTLTRTGVEIGAGTLHADAPGGTIRYLSTVGTAGDPGIDLVNKALANYQFDSLTSSIVYSPEGELILGMQLQGTNPEMSKDQRINLNLNLTDNIPALLKSLQAAREIEDFLQEQYK